MNAHEHSERDVETIEQAAHSAGVLSADEERREARRAGHGDARAFERLVRAHLRLVLAMAWEFRHYGVPHEDLVSEGMLGLLKAVRSFDSERGVRLASYAAWWIRAYLRRCTIDNRRIVRTPSSRAGRKVMAGLRRTERRLQQATGERPAAEEIARALGVTAADVEEMRTVLAAQDVPYDLETGDRRFDVACPAPSPEALAIDRQQRRARRELLRQALFSLSPRARRIVEQRNLEDVPRTLSDLSGELGISRERVRQIETQAKAQMRATLAPAVSRLALERADPPVRTRLSSSGFGHGTSGLVCATHVRHISHNAVPEPTPSAKASRGLN